MKMKLYLERVKKRLKENIEAGNLPLDQQFAIIEGAIDDLLATKNINEDAVQKHDNIIEQHANNIIKEQQAIAERYHKTYEEIIKL